MPRLSTSVLLLALVGAAPLTGCEDAALDDELERDAREALDDAGRELDNAGREVRDAAGEVGREVRDAAGEAGQGLREAADDVEDALDGE